MVNFMSHALLHGIDLHSHPILPFERTAHVCNIKTREENYIRTGEMIDCMLIDGKWFVSERLLKQYRFMQITNTTFETSIGTVKI